jgi:uncharacterized membrane protein YhfC
MGIHLSRGWLIAEAAVVVFAIVYPLVVALVVRRRLGAGWRYFGFGMLIFFLFQLITRVPLVQVGQALLTPQLRASRGLLSAWLALLAITAGLFEEIGRYLGYRWLMRGEEKTWPKAIMYGLGHGGLESIVLVGALGALTLVQLLTLSAIGLNALPAAQRATAATQIAALNAQPGWLPLAGAWERLWTLPIQVAFSVLVLQVFRRGQIRWLWLAVAAHALVDGVAVFLPLVTHLGTVGRTLLVEGFVAVCGLIALWVIGALRDRAPAAPAKPEAPAPGTLPGGAG